MGVCATNCYFLYREGGTKAVVVDPAENGAGIFRREDSLPDAGVKPVCPDAPCCDDRSG